MSNSALTKAFASCGKVKGNRRLVLLVLADYADDEGYSYPKKSTIQKRAAIANDEGVRECTQWLEEHGYIERVVNGWAGVRGQIPEGKRPNLYKVWLTAEGNPCGPIVARCAGDGAPGKTGRVGPGKTGSHGSRKNREQNPHSDPPLDPASPTPPEEGAQPELFGAADSGAATRASKTRKRDEQARAFKGMFKPLWKKYPVLAKGKGKGSEAAALRAMVKALKDDQLTSADLLFRVENFVAARQAYEDSWGKPAPLMNASTFFNGKHAMFDHEWDSDDLTYWPAPEGRDWAKPRKRSVEDILADDPEGVDA